MSAESLALWSKISILRPTLREHVKLYPQDYRGERWYVVYDETASQYLRFDARSYQLIGRLDGEHTLSDIFEQVNALDSVEPFTIEEFVQLLGQLEAAELLSNGLPVDVEGVYSRIRQQKNKQRQKALMNPLAIKLRLLEPEPILNFLKPVGSFIFSIWGFWLWGLTILAGLIVGLAYFEELNSDLSAIQFSPWQIGIIWVIYPLIKLLHELGHGLAIKKWGGTVKEAGVNLLVFLPVPYVDATASYAFRSKWKRIAVGAAGIMTELFIAAVALVVWTVIEPGLVREVLLNVVLIAVVSTLLFNGNPLLRFDGYFVLEDFLEIPNLGSRSKKYYFYLFQRYVLNLKEKMSPVTARGERFWFLFYGIASPLYRIVVMLAVALYLTGHYLFLGVVLAAWVVITLVISPLLSALHYLFISSETAMKRVRSYAFISVFLLVLFALWSTPLPLVTNTQGVVTGTGESLVTAGTSGMVEKIFVQSGQKVDKGQPLFELKSSELEMKKALLDADLKKLRIELYDVRYKDRVRANILSDEITTLEAEIAQVEKELSELIINSQVDGVFISAKPGVSLINQLINKGDLLGQVLNSNELMVKAFVTQERVGLVKSLPTSVEFVCASDLSQSFKSKIIREVPQAETNLLYPALSTFGGGTLLMETETTEQNRLKTPVFFIDLEMPEIKRTPVLGERVYVLLDHGTAPLGEQISMALNQAFLRFLSRYEMG